MKPETLLVLTTCDSADVAERLARGLVESRLAACVSTIDNVSSTYRWQGEIVRESEKMLLIKTTSEGYPAVEASIRELSGYELPEILAVRVDRGLGAYLDWVRDETSV